MIVRIVRLTDTQNKTCHFRTTPNLKACGDEFRIFLLPQFHVVGIVCLDVHRHIPAVISRADHLNVNRRVDAATPFLLADNLISETADSRAILSARSHRHGNVSIAAARKARLNRRNALVVGRGFRRKSRNGHGHSHDDSKRHRQKITHFLH